MMPKAINFCVLDLGSFAESVDKTLDLILVRYPLRTQDMRAPRHRAYVPKRDARITLKLIQVLLPGWIKPRFTPFDNKLGHWPDPWRPVVW